MTDEMIAAHIVAFALINLDFDLGLAVAGRVKQLAARGRQRRIAMNDRREAIVEHEAHALVETANAKRVRRDVDQHGADIFTGNDAALNGRAHRNN